MIYFRGDRTIRFAHIPRTGGRGISSGLYLNGWKTEYGLGSIFSGKAYSHLDLKTENALTRLQPEGAFAVVRHPVDRFLSAWKWEGQQIEASDSLRYDMDERIMQLSFYDHLLHIVMGLRGGLPNWYEPQVNFIDDDTHIWKFEDGLGEDFQCWVHEKVGISIHADEGCYREGQNIFPEVRNGDCSAPHPIEQIEEYYAEDMARFGYDSKLN